MKTTAPYCRRRLSFHRHLIQLTVMVGLSALTHFSRADAPSAEQSLALASLDPELAVLRDNINRMPAVAARALERARHDGFVDRRRRLAQDFEPGTFSDLSYNVQLANQRLAAFLRTPALPPLGTGSTSAAELQLYQPPIRLAPPPLSTGEPGSAGHMVPFSPINAATLEPFIDNYCAACHDDVEMKGNLDLTALAFKPEDSSAAAIWIRVHDRLEAGEMPPKKRRTQPDEAEKENFLGRLAAALIGAEEKRKTTGGRSTQRRLNGYEFENALRDLLKAPWLQVRRGLPDDGVAFRYNKIGEALDISHVQMKRFLEAAEQSMQEVIALALDRPEPTVQRYYARDQTALTNRFVRRSVFNGHPERMGFPILGTSGQPDVLAGLAPVTAGPNHPEIREQEAIATVHGSSADAFKYTWNEFRVPSAGRYRITFRGYTVWVGPYGYTRDFNDENDRIGWPGTPNWFQPNGEDIAPGRRNEPITLYSDGSGASRRLGTFDLTTTPTEQTVETWLRPGEVLWTDASRFYRSRSAQVLLGFTNPLAQADGMPGVAFQWMEIAGPFYEAGVDAGYLVLFGDLPLVKQDDQGWAVATSNPLGDARRLLMAFMDRAYRRPVRAEEYERYLALIQAQLDDGQEFSTALLTGYAAVLISPGFLFLEEQPGTLDDHALGSRLAFFLWNSPPDTELRELADNGRLREPAVLQAQTERLLDDPKSHRFVTAFLDYWLDLRKIDENSPSISLYPDYYLDSALQESALDETTLFFEQLVRSDLPARNIVASEFTFLNERLARHYGLAGVQGSALRPFVLPPDSPRGGLLTQASVLKVTANGTTSSPVLRGYWITERILGETIPPPPPVAAVEPDIRGAVTIREQLAKHRSDPSCASCHSKMDPPGFALESFDIFGGYRERYRAVAEGASTAKGFGMNGNIFQFHDALPVDTTGELPDGRTFTDIKDFKQLLLQSEEKIARNLTQQLTLYATGSPIRFADRDKIKAIVRQAEGRQYGVRTLVHLIVQSDLFRQK